MPADTELQKEYPARLSVAELRIELDAYIKERTESGKSVATTYLDRHKVSKFLKWLEK
jgi:hypothetical protein